MSLTPYYEDDSVTIYHGDALEILPTLPKVDLLLTDPPYFMPATHGVPQWGAEPVRTLGDLSVLEHWAKAWAEAVVAKMRPTSTGYIFCDGRSYSTFFRAWYPFGSTRSMVWDKGRGFNGYTWRYSHELIVWVRMQDAPQIPTSDGDVLSEPPVPTAARIHPAEKPVDLMRRLIAKHEETALVLDPFAGSGTVLVAAKSLGRKAIGIEIEERYCEMAATRCSQGTLGLAV